MKTKFDGAVIKNGKVTKKHSIYAPTVNAWERDLAQIAEMMVAFDRRLSKVEEKTSGF